MLSVRLAEVSRVLLDLPGSNAEVVFGSIDALKLRSCMTLFALLAGEDSVYASVLHKYFGGAMCEYTEEKYHDNLARKAVRASMTPVEEQGEC